MLVLTSLLASWPPGPSFFFLVAFQHSSLHQPMLRPPTPPGPDSFVLSLPLPPSLQYTQLHCCLNVSFETTEGHAVFVASRGKFYFDPFGVKSTHKKCIQGPSPASFTGVVRIWCLVMEQARSPRKGPFPFHLYPSS